MFSVGIGGVLIGGSGLRSGRRCTVRHVALAMYAAVLLGDVHNVMPEKAEVEKRGVKYKTTMVR